MVVLVAVMHRPLMMTLPVSPAFPVATALGFAAGLFPAPLVAAPVASVIVPTVVVPVAVIMGEQGR